MTDANNIIDDLRNTIPSIIKSPNISSEPLKRVFVSNFSEDDFFSSDEANIYLNYCPDKIRPNISPIHSIPHKETGQPVPHYNFAANYPPHVLLPQEIKHVIVTIPGWGSVHSPRQCSQCLKFNQ